VPGAGIVSNYFRSQGTTISPWDKFSIRVDHQVNTRNHFSFLLMDGTKLDQFGADGPPGLPMPFNGGSVTTTQSQSLRVSLEGGAEADMRRGFLVEQPLQQLPARELPAQRRTFESQGHA